MYVCLQKPANKLKVHTNGYISTYQLMALFGINIIHLLEEGVKMQIEYM